MIAFFAFAIPFTLYASLPSCFWNFDGVACAAALELGQPAYLFHANHLLYAALGFLFWKGLGVHIGLARALPALQLFTSLTAALGLIGLYRLLVPLTENKRVALLLTFTLSVTAAFWVWSLEAQVYALAFLALAWAACLLFQDPSPRRTIGVGLLHGAAVLGHVLHILWVFPASYWMLSDSRLPQDSARKEFRRYLLTLSAVIFLPYLFVVSFVIAPGRDLGRVFIWLKGSAGLTPDRHWAWHFMGWQGPWVWLKSTALAWWGIFWPYGPAPISPWMVGATALSAVVFLVLLIRGTLAQPKRTSLFCWLWLGAYGLFLSTWEPATLCYRMTDILPWGILLALGLKNFRGAAQYALITLLLIGTLAVNFAVLILPMSRIDQNTSYQEALHLSKITPPESLYITEGGMTWIYLLYFTGRKALNARNLTPERLRQAIAEQKGHGPVYFQKGTGWRQTA